MNRLFIAVLALPGVFYASRAAVAQTELKPLVAISAFPLQTSPEQLSIEREAVPSRPFSVVGPRGTVLGQQDGSYELWIFPRKILSNMRISAQMENYPVPIGVNEHASSIDVRPDSTILTFAHANFTVREIMLAPKHAPEGTGVLILYQIEAIRPMTLTFSFTPNMQLMWPAQSDDRPNAEWVKTGNTTGNSAEGSSGFYMLHLNFPDHAAAVAMPDTEPGILQPYQEHAATYPTQFELKFDPARDAHKLFPLLVAVGNTQESSTSEALFQRLTDLGHASQSIYEDNRAYYQLLLNTSMRIETPDTRLNEAFSWATVSIDQLRVETTPNHDEEALTAGFLESGDSVRPGFGWFFGRDSLWTIYAENSEGRFDTTRKEIEFLMRRQSPPGKMPHEWSQTANLVEWNKLPYEYASADATTLLPMAMNDYLRISGDQVFVAAHWDNLLRAWRFECSHDADGDGIYDNSEGTAWVESWIPKMPRQEIYLAALDEQASLAFANLARTVGYKDLATEAENRAAKIRQQIEKEYFLPESKFYAFSWNGAEGTDGTATIFPSVAWWDGGFELERSDAMLSRWASEEFSTDWGTREVSERERIYDAISYHQGSVWPLFTGWVSVAEYRAGHPLSGYAHLMQNADLTWSQDLGDVTELLSGRFFVPLGRSTAHQLWSSAMVISPAIRGLFGLEWNAPENTLRVTPQLPADWRDATLRDVPFGNAKLDLKFTRSGSDLVVEALHPPAGLQLATRSPGARVAGSTLHIPLPDVEVAISHALPEFGAETRQLKVLDQQWTLRHYSLTLSGSGGSTYQLLLRENAANLHVQAEGAALGPLVHGLRTATVVFPPDAAYAARTVTFQW